MERRKITQVPNWKGFSLRNAAILHGNFGLVNKHLCADLRLFRLCLTGGKRQLQVLLRISEAGLDGKRAPEFVDRVVEIDEFRRALAIQPGYADADRKSTRLNSSH